MAGQAATAPDDRRKALTRSTLYAWTAAYDEGGFNNLVDKPRADEGVMRRIVSLVWDGFFDGLISAVDHAQVVHHQSPTRDHLKRHQHCDQGRKAKPRHPADPAPIPVQPDPHANLAGS